MYMMHHIVSKGPQWPKMRETKNDKDVNRRVRILLSRRIIIYTYTLGYAIKNHMGMFAVTHALPKFMFLLNISGNIW